jgi:hypothetical protein
LLIPSLYAVYSLWKTKIAGQIATFISLLLILSPLGFFYFVRSTIDIEVWLAIIGVLVGITGLFAITKYSTRPAAYLLILGLIVARFGYSSYMVPFRVQTGPYLQEKTQGQQIAAITDSDDLGMYNANVALTMNWYITVDRQRTVETKTKNYSFDSYYLVPTEVIKDTANVNTYYTFVRRFEAKPFSLVKFKHRFPEMPKKKK